MVIKALNIKLWRDLWHLKMQTLTIAIILIGGIAALLSSWSSYRTLENARDNFYTHYNFADVFCEFKQAPKELATKLKKIPGVLAVEGRILIDGIVNLPNQKEPAGARVLSIPSGSQPALNRLHLRQGRLPLEGTETEVAVHEGFTKAQKLKLGDRFQILIEGHQEKVVVVGIATSPEYIYALSSSAPLPDDKRFVVIWMSYPTLSRLANQQEAINSITARLDPHYSVSVIKADIDQIFTKYGSRGTYTRDQQISNMFISDEISQQKGTAIVLPAIFFLVAGFLIHVIFSRLITLNRAPIATLKAIGFTDWEIAQHYLKLVILMTMMGTVPGILLGIWLGQVISAIYLDFYHFPEFKFILSNSALAFSLLSGIVPGILGAWQSIRKAFLLIPAEAMRPPVPIIFKKTIIYNIFSKKLMAPKTKIIIRNLLHRPARLLMIIFGMSTALAIIVTSYSWGDMVNEMLDNQFQRIQREDINLYLFKPVSNNGLQQLKKTDGVLSVEGLRVIPIRIRYLNHKKEITLIGWPENTQMRQILDLNLKKIAPPETGIMLGRFFYKKWGIRKGDIVEIEILEGSQKKTMARVTGFNDEMIGLSAGMHIQALWKLLGEENGYNNLMIKSDAHNNDQLYIKFKKIPMIKSIVLKSSMYQGFQNTMGKIINTSTTILVTFSIAIAIGVIYNSIRVNFSERSWEMASLRVIGFSKTEVFSLVFAEVLLQVFLSIIPGCFLGYWFTRLSLQGIHTETFAFPIIIHFKTYLKSSLIILLSLMASAALIYRIIDKLSLIEALKSRE